jgi:hypothetical protein
VEVNRTTREGTHYDAVLPDLNVIPNRRGFHYRASTDVNVIAYFHGVVVEVPSVGLVRWSMGGEDSQSAGLTTDLIIHPSPIRQYLPRDITTVWPGPVRRRSPLIIAPLAMIVLPPKMIFCGPAMVALRETLLPVS